MRFLCISDLHGHLPDLAPQLGCPGTPGAADAVLIAGDITPHPAKDYARQRRWLDGPFRRWLRGLGCPVIGIAGNHDWIFQEAPHMVPNGLPWLYLQDDGRYYNLAIYGTPWQPTFPPVIPPVWAFNADEAELCRRWSYIPANTEVLLVHGPPTGACDFVARPGGGHVGSPGLRARIEEVQPRLVVCGHIHGGYGTDRIGNTLVVNASLLGEDYRVRNRPVVVEVGAGPDGRAEVVN